jgi:hypothetical protein
MHSAVPPHNKLLLKWLPSLQIICHTTAAWLLTIRSYSWPEVWTIGRGYRTSHPQNQRTFFTVLRGLQHSHFGWWHLQPVLDTSSWLHYAVGTTQRTCNEVQSQFDPEEGDDTHKHLSHHMPKRFCLIHDDGWTHTVCQPQMLWIQFNRAPDDGRGSCPKHVERLTGNNQVLYKVSSRNFFFKIKKKKAKMVITFMSDKFCQTLCSGGEW